MAHDNDHGARDQGVGAHAATVDGLVARARSEEQRGELHDALRYYEAARLELGEDSDPARHADVVRWMGTARRELGETDEAEALYRQSLDIAEKADYTAGTAHALNCLAIVTQRRGEVDRAAGIYRRAARLATAAGEYRLCGMIEQNLGVLANIRGDLDGALVRYRSALDAFEAAHDREAMSWVLNNLGMLHTDLGQYREARESLRRGLRIAEERGDLGMQGVCHLNIAESYIAERRWDDAETPCETALKIASQRGDALRLAGALKFRGILDRERGHFESAALHHDSALALAREGRDTLLEAELLREIGTTHWRQSHAAPARACWKRSAALFRSIDASLDAAAVEALLLTVHDGALPGPAGVSGGPLP